MTKKILITSALLYANGPLHMGHLVEYIQTDIYSRFLRLSGKDAVYCCADDTHGAPIEINAEKQGITPKELIARSYKEHIRDFKRFRIGFDNYYTTDSPENKHYADKLFMIAKEKGYIYKKVIEQLFCTSCKRFLPDRYIKGTCPICGAHDQYGDVCEKCGSAYKPTELIDPRCTICGKEPVMKESEHYFFRLSAFSEKLKTWLGSNRNLQPEVVNSVRKWIDEGLQDWDISRDAPYFGFKIPGEDDLYYYVWWDAPIGYISSSENLVKDLGIGDAESVFWKNKDAEIVHFIGKDIIYFHFLFWPAVLMSAGYNLPEKIIVHGFLTVDGEKMSKSRGTFITAEEFLKKSDPEYLRFYFSRRISKKLADYDYNKKEFASKINNELVASIANFCHRVISYSHKNFSGKISKTRDEKELFCKIESLTKEAISGYEDVNFKEATSKILMISTLGNRYFQEKKPWERKDDPEVEEELCVCLNIAKKLAILIKPIMPDYAEKLEKQLGLHQLTFDDLDLTTRFDLGTPEILLKKIEYKADKREDKEKNKVKKDSDKEMPFNLVVGKVTKAEDHPDADRLLVLQVDIGSESRQIVAGLKEYYKADELLGKKIVIVKNLEYANMRGKESQGMLLAADDRKNVKIIEASSSEPGDRVFIEGLEDTDRTISFREFLKTSIRVRDNRIMIHEKSLRTEKEELISDMPDGSTVR